MDNPNSQPPAQTNPQLLTQQPTQPTSTLSDTPNEPHHTSPIVIILLLIFFAPLAWYFMWKEKRYHKWFAVLLTFYPIIAIIIIFPMAIFVIPKLTTLYKETGANPPTPWTPLLITLIVNLLQISFGIYLFYKAKSPLATPKILLLIAVTLLALAPITLGLSIVSIVSSTIMPIYNLTTKF